MGGRHRSVLTTRPSSRIFLISLLHAVNVNYKLSGVQFHPEKNQFEFNKGKGFPHSSDSIKAAQYLANFFVNETRRNSNGFSNDTAEAEALIYQFCPKYTGLKNGYYEQLYVFVKDDFDKNPLV